MTHTLESVFKDLAAHTAPACGSCRLAHACCNTGQCEATLALAKEDFGVDLTPLKTNHPTLPFLGATGCVVPPHLRPICSVHVCEKHLEAETPWTNRYWELRDIADDLLWTHLEQTSKPKEASK